MPLVAGLFGSTADQESRFLEGLAAKIDYREFHKLGEEAGFSPPNRFAVEAVARPLRSRAFPTSDFFEYQWAIYESGLERLRDYSPWMQLYLACLYVYCNKRRQWGVSVESDYFLLMVELALEDGERQESLALSLLFIEWLHDEVTADEGYDDYYCLLTWTLLRRLGGSVDHPCFERVVDELLEKAYSTEQLEELTVSDRGIEAWYDLHERIPCPELRRSDFEEIILGMAAGDDAEAGGEGS